MFALKELISLFESTIIFSVMAFCLSHSSFAQEPLVKSQLFQKLQEFIAFFTSSVRKSIVVFRLAIALSISAVEIHGIEIFTGSCFILTSGKVERNS
jgi:hypothetical protein